MCICLIGHLNIQTEVLWIREIPSLARSVSKFSIYSSVKSFTVFLIFLEYKVRIYLLNLLTSPAWTPMFFHISWGLKEKVAKKHLISLWYVITKRMLSLHKPDSHLAASCLRFSLIRKSKELARCYGTSKTCFGCLYCAKKCLFLLVVIFLVLVWCWLWIRRGRDVGY